MAGLFSWVFARLLGRWRGVVLAALMISLYTLLVGANAAVVLAAILGVLALGARQVGRRQEGVNRLSFVAALMALCDWYIIWGQVKFRQLSNEIYLVSNESRQAMNPISPVDILRKWDFEVNQIPPEESTLPHRFEFQTLRLLAKGEPVSAQMVGSKLGIPKTIAQSVFDASRGKGEWDSEGRLIGSALTLVPTHHRFRVMDNNLYTWCALDTILLPGILGMTAEVMSPDPLNGDLIKLVITPKGPETYTPESAVLTIFQASEPATGPTSAVCTNSHYFTSQASAEAWSHDRPGVSIMTVEDAFSNMKRILLDQVQPILDQLD